MFIECWQKKLDELDELDEIHFENKPFAFSTLLLVIYKHMDDGVITIFGFEDVRGMGDFNLNI